MLIFLRRIKSKALIPGAFGMRAKLAFVTRISEAELIVVGNRGKTTRTANR
jgi:hypothetical protein